MEKVKITIENFKYFHESFPLEVNSRNMLVYGENGSGKSSIYWALYTLFQSRLKPTDADVEKYFDAANGENLRNKYSAFTIASSDFLNYKMLLKLTDKDNSVINDITDLFVKEIYPFADFQIEYTDLNGNPSGTRNAQKWHDYIYTSINQLEHQRGRRRNHFDKTGVKYGRYKTLIRDFRDQLSLYLADLSLRSTAKLENDFKIKDVELRFETDSSYDFDLLTAPRSKYRDHKLHPLHIRLNARLKNAQLAGGSVDIIHLRTFFNEAKLTCIGLAVRLAVADMKYVSGVNLASVLCLDDMLVSLDMSYRVPVTMALLKYAQNYQLCVFTHDRSLFNMMKNEIKELGYAKEDWLKLEFYRSDPAKEATEEPKVNKVEPKEGVEQVKAYIAQGDYPAAGNCLRKYAEELIKGILPLNLTYGISDDGDLKKLMLRALFDNTRSAASDGFLTLYEITKNDMPNISKHLNRLMNPLSHDDKNVPIFRQELEAAIIEVQKYEPIRDAKKVIVGRQDFGHKRFKMEMTNAATGVTKSVEFVATEQWDYFDFSAPMGKKYKDCEVLIKVVNGCSIPLNCKMRVKKLYKELRIQSQLNAVAAPAFDQCITEITTGTLLSAF